MLDMIKNRVMMWVVGILLLLLVAVSVRSYIVSSTNRAQKEKIVHLEAAAKQVPLEQDAAKIAAKAEGEIEQIDKEVVDENVTYDVGIFHYRFD